MEEDTQVVDIGNLSESCTAHPLERDRALPNVVVSISVGAAKEGKASSGSVQLLTFQHVTCQPWAYSLCTPVQSSFHYAVLSYCSRNAKD